MGDYYRKYLVRVQLVRESKAKLDKVINAGSIVKIVSKHIEKYDREHLVVVYLDFGNNVVGIEEVSKGTLGGTSASPREIFKGALLSNACSIILLHNHTSGDTKPSYDDIKATNTINSACKLMEIELVDHIIIGSNGAYLSMKDKGLIL